MCVTIESHPFLVSARGFRSTLNSSFWQVDIVNRIDCNRAQLPSCDTLADAFNCILSATMALVLLQCISCIRHRNWCMLMVRVVVFAGLVPLHAMGPVQAGSVEAVISKVQNLQPTSVADNADAYTVPQGPSLARSGGDASVATAVDYGGDVTAVPTHSITELQAQLDEMRAKLNEREASAEVFAETDSAARHAAAKLAKEALHAKDAAVKADAARVAAEAELMAEKHKLADLERHRADAKQASTQQISTHTVETTSQETTQILERLDHLLNKNTEKSSSWPELPVSLQSTTIALLVASACVASMLFLLLIAGCCYRNYQNSPEAFHDILDHAIRGMRRRQAGDAQEADRMAQLRAAQFQPPGTGGDAGPRIFAPTSGGRMVMGAGI